MTSLSTFFGKPEGEVDPNAGSGKGAAVASGAAMGSMFGPVGAVVGGVLGGVFGGSSRGQRKRARRKATQQSYRFGQDAYSYLGQGREQAGKTFESKLSYARARMGASGATLGQSWEGVKGHLIRERDTALSGLDKEQKEFRSSKSYEWLKKDYEYLGGMVSHKAGFGGRDERSGPTTYKVGQRYKGRSNRKMFTGEQYNSLRTYKTSFGDTGGGALYREYAERVKPTMDAFEKGQFGSKAEKKAYKAEVGRNIEAANKWYDIKRAEQLADAAASKEFRRYEPRGEGPQR